ncbi:unnamed protein product [Owenia fusiformis]|uniref:Uncharacterized protein n=1 Tax=Owenia fusiformis TaxID=6347 RepID=A0A8J1UHG9_OWEFU|nr:unnamed protein product [Owenia fusiformis]
MSDTDSYYVPFRYGQTSSNVTHVNGTGLESASGSFQRPRGAGSYDNRQFVDVPGGGGSHEYSNVKKVISHQPKQLEVVTEKQYVTPEPYVTPESTLTQEQYVMQEQHVTKQSIVTKQPKLTHVTQHPNVTQPELTQQGNDFDAHKLQHGLFDCFKLCRDQKGTEKFCKICWCSPCMECSIAEDLNHSMGYSALCSLGIGSIMLRSKLREKYNIDERSGLCTDIFSVCPFYLCHVCQLRQEIDTRHGEKVTPLSPPLVADDMQAGQPREWTTGLLNCTAYADPWGRPELTNKCISTIFCAPCVEMGVADDLGENACLPCLGPVGSLALRTKLRRSHNIEGTICGDLKSVCFCYCCHVCQMSREIEAITNATKVKMMENGQVVTGQPISALMVKSTM